MPSFESRDRYITRSRLGTVTEHRERTRTNTFHSLAIVAVSACPAGFDYVQNPRYNWAPSPSSTHSITTSPLLNVGAYIITYTMLGVPLLYFYDAGPQNPILIIKADI